MKVYFLFLNLISVGPITEKCKGSKRPKCKQWAYNRAPVGLKREGNRRIARKEPQKHRGSFYSQPPSVSFFYSQPPEGPPHPLLHTGMIFLSERKDSSTMDYIQWLFSALRGSMKPSFWGQQPADVTGKHHFWRPPPAGMNIHYNKFTVQLSYLPRRANIFGICWFPHLFRLFSRFFGASLCIS